MHKLLALMLALAAAACGGGDDSSASPDAPPGTPDAATPTPDAAATWDEAVADFIHLACVEIAECAEPSATCMADMTTDFADAMAALDAAGEQRCIHCLEAKIALGHDFIANHCQPGDIDPQTVYAACDLDPTVDYDGDGTANNDHDEACAGFP
jgi:hypothetical protein